ncbi:hypothetical protein BCV70DRAFT_201485 [Testicularia cyperi]|uniref:RRM domain-containing protein n=1 Tax=Testicularia cyperi TaxID=1882483 RepID=A0A317XK65_9BASI|nr:hypothetical protein BCV70DRAFT_201485 [Testicularia cyperi]
MTDTEAQTTSTTAPAVTVDTAESSPTTKPLTNKEKRLLAVAQKRKAKEDAASQKHGKPDEKKRKRQDGDVDGDGDNAEHEGEGDGEGEIEVVSHKEQRRRRKLAKAMGLDPSDPAALEQAANGGAGGKDPNSLLHPSRQAVNGGGVGVGASIPRSGFSVWVGNMSFFTPPEKLVDWFNTRGIDGISRVHMPKGARRAEMNRGFAYVDLPNSDVLTAALNLSEQPLDGRKLLIKNGADFTGRPALAPGVAGIAASLSTAPAARERTWGGANDNDDNDDNDAANVDADAPATDPTDTVKQGKTGLTKTAQKILRAQKNPASMTLFLGNLSFNTTEAGVREMFERSAARRADSADSAKLAKIKAREARREKRNLAKKNKRRAGDAGGALSEEEEEKDSEYESEDEDSDDDEEGEEEEEKKMPSKEVDGDSESDSSSSSSSGSSSSTGDKPKPDAVKSSGDGDGDGESDPSAPTSKTTAGIRKIRLGTFEDAPTKCKGFGFVDFYTLEYATASLLDVRNAFLDGRKLVLQFASAEATRRGASRSQKLRLEDARASNKAGPRGSRLRDRDAGGDAGKSKFGFAKRRKFVDYNDQDRDHGHDHDHQDATAGPSRPQASVKVSASAPAPGTFDPEAPLPKKHKETQQERLARRQRHTQTPSTSATGGAIGGAAYKRREKPGAALANAQRASSGIVASTGTKVTFDD